MRRRRSLHIGLYVHDRGHASRSRAAALLRHLRAEVTVLTALPAASLRLGLRTPMVRLAPSVSPGTDPAAPLARQVSRERARTVLDWIDQEAPDLLVVDGCPALAGVAHLAGVPTVGVRVLGAAWGTWPVGPPMPLIAPYTEDLELPEVPGDVRRQTAYVGAYSALDGRAVERALAREALDLRAEDAVVTVMAGASGLGDHGERRLLEAAASTRRWRWLVTGRFDRTEGVVPDNLRLLGWREDPRAPLAAADVVASTGGHATTADVASVRRPHLVLQEPGSTDDLNAAVAQIVRGRVATVLPLWPAADDWAELLADVRGLDTTPQERFCDHRGAERLARQLTSWAEGTGASTPAA